MANELVSEREALLLNIFLNHYSGAINHRRGKFWTRHVQNFDFHLTYCKHLKVSLKKIIFHSKNYSAVIYLIGFTSISNNRSPLKGTEVFRYQASDINHTLYVQDFAAMGN